MAILIFDIIYNLLILISGIIILFDINNNASNRRLLSQIIAAFLFVMSIKNIVYLFL